MATIKGEIIALRTIERPTPRITKRRFTLREHFTNENFYLECFNNTRILNDFEEGDHVAVEYNSKSTEKENENGEKVTYTNNYANKIIRIPIPDEKGKWEKGKLEKEKKDWINDDEEQKDGKPVSVVSEEVKKEDVLNKKDDADEVIDDEHIGDDEEELDF